ncbi:MAG: hypothetical protein Q8O51_02395 [bacterium]|nr:hypothetical protein [bacterium]
MAQTQRRDKDNEPKPSRFGLGKKEWLFVKGLLTLRLWFNIPRGSTELTGTIYGQPITSPPTTAGLTLVEILGVDPQLSPRLDVTCTTGTGEVLTHTQDIPVEQPVNTERVEVKWRDFKDGDVLCLEVAARVLSLAGRVLPPVPVTFTFNNEHPDPVLTDPKGIAPTTFRTLEYNRTYTLTVATPSSGTRSEPIKIKPARAVAYDIHESVVLVATGQPTHFTLKLTVWDDVKVVPLRGLKVNGYACGEPQSDETDDRGIAELTFPMDTRGSETRYRVLVEDGKEKLSFFRHPIPIQSRATEMQAPRNFREAFCSARDKQVRKE